MSHFLYKNTPSQVETRDDIKIASWYGLRFAQLNGRFQPAKRAMGQLSVDELSQVPIFPQLNSRLSDFMGKGVSNPMSEDAFFLNVWAPEGAQNLPVLLFIHGGAWMTGGAAQSWYDGSRLAAQGMIVMTISYRLGALGHLGQSTDCDLPLPAADLVLALQWVMENGTQFGGDVNKLTLMGQSAGGWYAHLLSTLDQTKGMIHKVALSSMGTRRPWSAAKQNKITAKTTNLVGDLLQVAPVEVLKAGVKSLQEERANFGYAPAAFLPVASAHYPNELFHPQWAAEHTHAQEFYIRYTADESAAFFYHSDDYVQATQEQVDRALSSWPVGDLPPALVVGERFCGAESGLSPYKQLVAASSWRQFQRFPTEYMQQLRALDKPVVYSYFETQSPLPYLYSAHCFDLPFQFGIRQAWRDAPMLQGVSEEFFEEESKKLLLELARFVCS